MAVQFQSYGGGPHGGGPIVLPRQAHPVAEIGNIFDALGNIPMQMQQAKLRQGLNELFLKALSTPSSISKVIPGATIYGDSTPPDLGTTGPISLGDVMSREPDQIISETNPEFADIAKKLEIMGYYRPTSSRGDRYETPEEEARRAGLKEEAVQRAKAPEREIAREAITSSREADRELRRTQGEENRELRREEIRARQELDRQRAEDLKESREQANAIRQLTAQAAITNAQTRRMELEQQGEKKKADEITRLQARLTDVQNQIKNPPPTSGGDPREWNYSDPKDKSTIRGYIQQENTIMDQLEKHGVMFPERRKLMEVENGFLRNLLNYETTSKIVPIRKESTSSAVGGTPPTNQQPTKPQQPTKTETLEERRRRLLGEMKVPY